MENFYVTYDATNPDQHRLGLSYDISQADDSSNESKNLVFALAFILITLFVLLVIAAILFVCLYMRKKQADRLAKAKAYFAALQTHDEEPDGQALDQEDVATDENQGISQVK